MMLAQFARKNPSQKVIRMCAPTLLYHPSRHRWRRTNEKSGLQLWKHVLARYILTVAILCCCLAPVATGLSERCFVGPTMQCGFVRERFLYSNTRGFCYKMLSWSCDIIGFSTLDECETVCEVNSTSTDSSMEPPTPGEADPLSGMATISATATSATATSAIPPSQGSFFPLPVPAASQVMPLVSMATRDPTPSMSPDSGTAIPDLCFLPPVNTICFPLRNYRRYYYSSGNNECIGFTFFNCSMNENNFLTREECLATCGRRTMTTTSSLVYTFQTTEPLPTATLPAPSSTSHVTSHMTSHVIIPMSTNVVVQMVQTNLPLPPPTSPQTHEPSVAGTSPGQGTTSEVTMTTSHSSPEISLVAPTTSDVPASTATTSPVTTPANTSPPTTGSTSDQTVVVPGAAALSVFDYASVGVGVLALCLTVLLVSIMGLVVYRYRRRLRENAVIKQVNPTLSSPANGHNSTKESSHLKRTRNDYCDYRCENLYTTV